MNQDDREDNASYKVVVNHEEQYSIWPADRENALGWNDAGKVVVKAEKVDGRGGPTRLSYNRNSQSIVRRSRTPSHRALLRPVGTI